MDRLTEMEAFATVVDQGGFTGAARKLNLSKSAVSKHVSSLETRLGVRLLNRTTRRVNPTEMGLLYYERAQQVLAAAKEADGMVGTMNSEPEGSLRVAVHPDYGQAVIAPKLPAFLETHEAISVEMVLINRPVELKSEGFDLALAPGTALSTNQRSRVVGTYRLELVASPDYLKRQGRPNRVEDLVSHELLHGGGAETEGAWQIRAPSGELRTVRGTPRVSMNCAQAVRDMAIDGLGIALLPDYMIGNAIAKGTLERAVPNLPEQTRQVVAMLPQAHYTKPKTAAFLEMIEADNHQPIGKPASVRAI